MSGDEVLEMKLKAAALTVTLLLPLVNCWGRGQMYGKGVACGGGTLCMRYRLHGWPVTTVE